MQLGAKANIVMREIYSKNKQEKEKIKNDLNPCFCAGITGITGWLTDWAHGLSDIKTKRQTGPVCVIAAKTCKKAPWKVIRACHKQLWL